MKRPEQHEIDTAAQRAFKSLLPSSWVVRDQTPDYGIDYIIDVFEKGEATGLQFAVQLKGKRSIKIKNGEVAYGLETAHLAYYVDKVRQPLFLVLFDVSAGEGYWLFLQQHALDSFRGKEWRKNRSVTIRIPASNLLRDTTSLRQAVAVAENYMTGLRPTALTAAIEAETRRLESKDPRFQVKVLASNEGVIAELFAKEIVSAKFTFIGKDPALATRVEDLVGRGLPVKFSKGEISVDGLPAIDEVVAEGVTMRWARSLPGTVQLSLAPGGRPPSVTMDSITGAFVGGIRETRFEGQLGTSPFNVAFTLRLGEQSAVDEIRMSCNFERWSGQPLQQLSYFDQLLSVLGPTVDGQALVATCFVDGNQLFSADLTPTPESIAVKIGSILRSLNRAREVARILGVNPTFQGDLTDDELGQADFLHDVLSKGASKRAASGERFSISVAHPNPAEIRVALEGEGGKPLSGTLTVRGGPYPYPFFRDWIALQNVEVSVTHAILTSSRDSTTALLDKGGRPVPLEWEGASDSELIVRQLPSTERLETRN